MQVPFVDFEKPIVNYIVSIKLSILFDRGSQVYLILPSFLSKIFEHVLVLNVHETFGNLCHKYIDRQTL